MTGNTWASHNKLDSQHGPPLWRTITFQTRQHLHPGTIQPNFNVARFLSKFVRKLPRFVYTLHASRRICYPHFLNLQFHKSIEVLSNSWHVGVHIRVVIFPPPKVDISRPVFVVQPPYVFHKLDSLQFAHGICEQVEEFGMRIITPVALRALDVQVPRMPSKPQLAADRQMSDLVAERGASIMRRQNCMCGIPNRT